MVYVSLCGAVLLQIGPVAGSSFCWFHVRFFLIGYFLFPIGFLYDLTSNYDLTFYTAGAGMILSSLMLLLFPVVKRVVHKRRKVKILVKITAEKDGDVEMDADAVHPRKDGETDSEDEDIQPLANGHPKLSTGLPFSHEHPYHHAHRTQLKSQLLEAPTIHVGNHLLSPIIEDETVVIA